MIKKWLKEKSHKEKSKYFTIYKIEEDGAPSSDILNYLGEQTMDSYRILKGLKNSYARLPEKDLKEYLNNYVFPPLPDPFNVRQGDFGETLARLFVEKFRNLEVPCYKLRYKFNNAKAVFCTDIFSHNGGEEILELKYYEVKTKITDAKTKIDIKGKEERRHIGVIAHESLAKDNNKTNTEGIADFVKRLYEEKAQVLDDEGLPEKAEKYWNIALKYNDIVNNPEKYKRSFELVLIIEKGKYSDEVLKDLEKLPPSLSPLDVTVITIDGIKDLTENSINKAVDSAVNYVYDKHK